MSKDWITLRTFDTPALAELAKLHLAEAGIDCQLLNTEIVGMNPLWGNAVGYIPLQVWEQDHDAAEEVLTAIAPADALLEAAAAESEPVSEAESISLDRFRRWWHPLVLLFLVA